MREATKPRGRRGDGTIFTTKDGRHRASITVRDIVTGKPRRVWLSGKTPTEVRRKFGLEAAQTVLGHARADVTQVYAERDHALAASVMKERTSSPSFASEPRWAYIMCPAS